MSAAEAICVQAAVASSARARRRIEIAPQQRFLRFQPRFFTIIAGSQTESRLNRSEINTLLIAISIVPRLLHQGNNTTGETALNRPFLSYPLVRLGAELHSSLLPRRLACVLDH